MRSRAEAEAPETNKGTAAVTNSARVNATRGWRETTSYDGDVGEQNWPALQEPAVPLPTVMAWERE
jgi:hypothetical protein